MANSPSPAGNAALRGPRVLALRAKWAAAVRLPDVNFIDDEEGKPVGNNSHIGRLDRGLDEADARGWIVIDMKNDWRRIFP